MNNIFDFKRFGNYFLYGLRRAKNNYWLSLLLLGFFPVIFFVFTMMFSLIFKGHTGVMPSEMKTMAAFLSALIVLVGAGTRLYGNLTEKRSGSDFLLLPASTLEKWLSMVLLICIVLPAALFLLMFAADGLMGLLFPNTYGASIMNAGFFHGLNDGLADDMELSFNLPAISFLNWCENALAFTLGAVCFKKNKIARTFLCLFLFGIVMSILMAVLLFGNVRIESDQVLSRFGDIEHTVRFFNVFLNILYTLVIGALLGGLYYRLRTLKL